jgi:hypothetical protein
MLHTIDDSLPKTVVATKTKENTALNSEMVKVHFSLEQPKSTMGCYPANIRVII